ncbi:hypothetical protein [Ekhidna sp.]
MFDYMRTLVFCLASLILMRSNAQSEKCDFPETWVVDQSSIIITQTTRIEGEESRVDTLEQVVGEDLVNFPTSATFDDGKMTLFSSENKSLNTGTYVLKKKKFSWTLKDDGVSTSTKVLKENIRCELLNEGIPFFINVPKKILGKGVVVSFTLRPQALN